MVKISKLTSIVVVAVVIILAICVWYRWYHDSEKKVAQTTSKQSTAQSDFTKGGSHDSSPNTGVAQGGAKDNKGDSSATSGETGVSSTSGNITVVSPASGGTLTSGDTVRGTANGVSEVQFRLIDNSAGVIAQGSLSVVNGTYSGTLQFKAYSTSGQLDVFTYNSQGQEANEVQMPVALEP